MSLILLLLSFFLGSSETLKMTGASYEIKRGTFFGSNWTLAVAEVTLDEELVYIPEYTPCGYCRSDMRTSDSKEEVESVDLRKWEFVKAHRGGEANNSVGLLVEDDPDEELEIYSLSLGDIHYYRTKLDSCTGLIINMVPRVNNVRFSVSTKPPAEGEEFKPFKDRLFIIDANLIRVPFCPGDTRNENGEYFIQVETSYRYAEYSFELVAYTVIHAPLLAPTVDFAKTANFICSLSRTLQKNLRSQKDNEPLQCSQKAVPARWIPEEKKSQQFVYYLTPTTNSCVILFIRVQAQPLQNIFLFVDLERPFPSDYQETDVIRNTPLLFRRAFCFDEEEEEVEVFFSVYAAYVDDDEEVVIYADDFIPSPTSTEAESLSYYSPTHYKTGTVGSFELDCPTQKYTCDDEKYDCEFFWLLPPTTDVNVFNPPPSISRTYLSELEDITLEINYDEIRFDYALTGILRFAILLEADSPQRTVNGVNFLELPNCKITSRNYFVNEDLQPLVGSISMVENETLCAFDLYKNVSRKGRNIVKQILEVSNQTRALELDYDMSSLLMTNGFQRCRRDTFLALKTVASTSTLTIPCPLEPGTVEYEMNSCCNASLQIEECCVPSEVQIDIPVPFKVNYSVLDRCQSSDCTEDYAIDYLNSFKFDINVFALEDQTEVDNNNQALSACMDSFRINDLLNGIACEEDSDCIIGNNYGLNATEKLSCNKFTRFCQYSKKFEEAFLECLVDGMDLFFRSFTKLTVGLPMSRDNDNSQDTTEEKRELISAMHVYYSDPECLVRSNDDELRISKFGKSGYFLDVPRDNCSDRYKCPTNYFCPEEMLCTDENFQLKVKYCEYYCDAEWKYRMISRQDCPLYKKCNWNRLDCFGEACEDLEQRCSRLGSFCAICDQRLEDCIPIEGLDSEEECLKQNTACLLPGGKVDLTLTEEMCEQSGSCFGGDCAGRSCRSAQGDCYDTSLSKTVCETSGGTFSSSVCYFPHLSSGDCKRAGYLLGRCSELRADECLSEDHRDWACLLLPYEDCRHQQECIESGGTCSDRQFFLENNLAEACFEPLRISNRAPIVYCPGVKSQFGCLKPIIKTKKECLQRGYFWHTLAASEKECEATKACAHVVPSHYLFRDQSDCEECNGNFTNIFSWKKAKWVFGKNKVLHWIKPKLVPVYHWIPSLNYSKLFNDYVHSSLFRLLDGILSQEIEAFREDDSIHALACACTTEDSDCFTDSEQTLESLSFSCIGRDRLAKTEVGAVLIDQEQISKEEKGRLCIRVETFLISASLFRRQDEEPLSVLRRNFKYQEWSVVMDGDRIVGQVAGNGLILKLVPLISQTALPQRDVAGPLHSFIHKVRVCLLPRTDLFLNDYDTFDFGWSTDYDTLHLFDYDVHLEKQNSTSKIFCGWVRVDHLEFGIFLIKRLSDAQLKTSDGELYSDDEVILLYVLASCFVVCGLYCSYLVLRNILFRISFSVVFYLTIFFLFLVSTMRATYFYLIAAGTLTADHATVIDYFLIELPTLFLFTAYTCLLAFWIWVRKPKKSRLRRLMALTFFFNLITYIVFLILVLVFEYLPPETTSSDCPGRFPDEDDTTVHNSLAIFYQSLLAGVFILLCLFIIFFAGLVMKDFKRRDRYQFKLMVLVTIVVISFLCHCGFFIYLVATKSTDTITIFVGLMLTEVIPMFLVSLMLDKPLIEGCRKVFSSLTSTSLSQSRESQSGKSVTH